MDCSICVLDNGEQVVVYDDDDDDDEKSYEDLAFRDYEYSQL